ncbi:hypothetical protein HDU67_004683 [Dinochytrium kinnereticum]|nr:hypothetical protein HDU67_004683 [Dinochytrium kinnereticum]
MEGPSDSLLRRNQRRDDRRPDPAAFRKEGDNLLNHLGPNVKRPFVEEAAVLKSLLPMNQMGPGFHPLRVAVDVSGWFYTAKGAESDGSVSNPVLRNAFYKCVKLIRFGLLPVFVFDSLNRRPEVKKVVLGKSSSHEEMQKEIRKLAHIFKFAILDAETEAEAECARLNSLGIVDAILSNDVDCFLFGGQLVLKSTFDSADCTDEGPSTTRTPLKKRRKVDAGPGRVADFVDVLSASRIEEATGVNRNGMILTALLGGSDYAAGVPGVGIKTAFQVAQCGYGDLVVDATLESDFDCLSITRDEIETECRTNRFKKLSRRRASLTLPKEWPEKAVVEAYATPILALDQHDGLAASIARSLSLWDSEECEPDLPAIKSFLGRVLGWGAAFVDEKVRNLVLPALRLRRVRVEAHRRALSVTESQIKEVEMAVEKRCSEEARKTAGRSIKRVSSFSQDSKITHFFSVKKSNSISGGIGGLVKSKSELSDMYGLDDDADLGVSPDSSLISEILSTKVSKEGVELVKVRFSSELSGAGFIRCIAESTAGTAPPPFSSSSRNPFLTQQTPPSSDILKHNEISGSACEDEGDNCEWIEASLARVLAPQAFFTYLFRQSLKPSRKVKTPIPTALTIATPSNDLSSRSGFQKSLEMSFQTPSSHRKSSPIRGSRGKPAPSSLAEENAFWGIETAASSPLPAISPYLPDPFDSDDDVRPAVRSSSPVRRGIESLADGTPRQAIEEDVLRAPRKRKVFATIEDLSFRQRDLSPLSRRARENGGRLGPLGQGNVGAFNL